MTGDRARLGQAQKRVRQWCKQNKLPRQYEREKAYGVAKQPRALGKLQKAARTTAPAWDQDPSYRGGKRSKIGGLSKQDKKGSNPHNAAKEELKDHINNYPTGIEEGKQKAHIPGTKEFTQKLISMRIRAERLGIRSYPSQSFLTIGLKEAEELMAASKGHGLAGKTRHSKWDHTELCEAPEIIGASVTENGDVIYTKWFKIHYSNKGTHMVPCVPNNMKEDDK